MKKPEEFQTSIALTIGLAIIPIDRWSFAVMATTTALLVLRIIDHRLRSQSRWLRYSGVAASLILILTLLVPAIRVRYG